MPNRYRAERSLSAALFGVAVLAAASFATSFATHAGEGEKPKTALRERRPLLDALRLVAEGRSVFRYDTFGDEDFWGGHAAAARGDRQT